MKVFFNLSFEGVSAKIIYCTKTKTFCDYVEVCLFTPSSLKKKIKIKILEMTLEISIAINSSTDCFSF